MELRRHGARRSPRRWTGRCSARPLKPEIDATLELSRDDDIPADALFDQVYVDQERLGAKSAGALQRRTQVSLAEVAAAHPLEHGLAELVAYLSLASDDPAAVIDDERRRGDPWTDAEGRRRQATLPLVIFARAVSVGDGRGLRHEPELGPDTTGRPDGCRTCSSP